MKKERRGTVLLGAGNVAFHMIHGLNNAGYPVTGIYNRTPARAHALAVDSEIQVFSTLQEIPTEASLYLICVSDSAIPEIAALLADHIEPYSLVIHTSGTVSAEILGRFFPRSGVLYPLQSLRSNVKTDLSAVPMIIYGNTPGTLETIRILAGRLSGHIIELNDEQRRQLHLPAVIVNNFVNHLYAVAYDICSRLNLPFDALLPLIRETADRLDGKTDPESLQTGPAIREDHETMSHHREMLTTYTAYLELYDVISKQIRHFRK